MIVVADHRLGRQDDKIAVDAAFEGRDKVAASQQTRHSDSRTPKLAFNGDSLEIHTQAIHALFQVRIKDFSGAHSAARATGGFLF